MLCHDGDALSHAGRLSSCACPSSIMGVLDDVLFRDLTKPAAFNVAGRGDIRKSSKVLSVITVVTTTHRGGQRFCRLPVGLPITTLLAQRLRV